MPALESLFIEKFRGLQDLQLNELGRINLMVGTNNSGKTSVLEALSIYSDPLNLREWWETSNSRIQEPRATRSSVSDAIKWLFPHNHLDEMHDDSNLDVGCISLSSQGTFPLVGLAASYEQIEELRFSQNDTKAEERAALTSGIELSVKIISQLSNEKDHTKFIANPPDLEDTVSKDRLKIQIWDGERVRFPRSSAHNFLVETVTPVSHRLEDSQFRLLSEARYQNFKSEVIDLLNSVDSGIEDIEILADLSSASALTHFSIYIQHATLGLAPLDTFGDGIRRLLHIALKVVRVKGGVLLIDEIESTIHTEALQSSYYWLAKWCEEMDVQLFATTHSLEAVDALLDVTNSQDDLVLFRLEPSIGKTKVTRHDWSRLKILREELGQEVRW
ncbi:MAG: ATP/GTP-binding protein [Phormidesmis sp.]